MAPAWSIQRIWETSGVSLATKACAGELGVVDWRYGRRPGGCFRAVQADGEGASLVRQRNASGQTRAKETSGGDHNERLSYAPHNSSIELDAKTSC